MSIINFDASDRMASAIPPTGWYTLEVDEIDGPKPSKSGKSNNFFFRLTIVKGDYQGKELTITFSTGSNSPSMLGTSQWFPKAWMLPLAAAIQNCPIESVSPSLDTDDLLHRPFDAKLDKIIAEGVPTNSILTFLPAGTGKDATAPF